ncbi:MAG: hypothetical protein AMQ22_02323 [Candidatus Methanofastidiosum methylothiophilum]|uniref:Uncharacterized protein n=1 Tax=Candidatus Methanofastidiosum methylothiophilum TaxID=1705564 RepID=A0A150IH39_9EURY|nr:MAG: hypothetical protein AMQ22_02323 [Candidatus Methanofastidiosum methylthiophilus]
MKRSKEEIIEYQKKYYQEHKEQIKQRNAQRVEQIKEYHRQYWAEHSEQVNRKRREAYSIDGKDKMRQYYLKNKDEILQKDHEYYANNKNKIKVREKKWRDNNKKRISDLHRRWVKEHSERAKELFDKWREDNPIRYKELKAKYRHERRRSLDFIPLNIYFQGSHGHHLNKELVLFIPEELHRSVAHSLKTGRGMEEINTLAVQWYMRNYVLNSYHSEIRYG